MNNLENPVIVAVLRTVTEYREHEEDIKTAMRAAADQEAARRGLAIFPDELWERTWVKPGVSSPFVSASELTATHVKLELQRNVL